MSIARTNQVPPYSTNHNHHYHNKYALVAVLQPPYIKQEECGTREQSRCKEGFSCQGGILSPRPQSCYPQRSPASRTHMHSTELT